MSRKTLSVLSATITVLFLSLNVPAFVRTEFPNVWAATSAEIEEHVLVDLVDLYVTATDKNGNFITDLTKEEIVVKEDGVAQVITRFANSRGLRGEVPLSVAFMIDNSGSMYDDIEGLMKIEMARETGVMLAGELAPWDQMMIISFDETPQINPLTSDKTAINQTLQTVRVRFGHTALFDAIVSTVKELSDQPGRKVLVLCSDGVDNLSRQKLDDVLKAMANSPELTTVIVGTVAKDAPTRGPLFGGVKVKSLHDQGTATLRQMAEKTAGFAFFPTNRKEVQKVRELVRSFVRSQYSLVYRSSNRKMNGAWRNIEIESKRKNVKLHYRKGYYAPKKEGTRAP